jgi:type VI secretion system secreted protein Hcp
MAGADIFLKLDGIKGESQDSKHKDEIELSSWSIGETNAGSSNYGGGAGTGKVQITDIHFTKPMDKASANLFKYCALGAMIKTATLVCRKAGGKQEEYLKIELKDVKVSSTSWSGHGGGGEVSEQFSLNFTSIHIEYKPQKADGTLEAPIIADWNIKASAEK